MSDTPQVRVHDDGRVAVLFDCWEGRWTYELVNRLATVHAPDPLRDRYQSGWHPARIVRTDSDEKPQ